MADTDIENFIARQKAKLASERQTLNNSGMNQSVYQQQWQQHHNGTSPRGPGPNVMGGSKKLDTDSIISQVVKETGDDLIPRKPRADMGQGLNNINPINAGGSTNRDEYRRGWQERQNQSKGVLTPRSQNQGGGALLIRDDGRRDESRRKMEEERNRDYNDLLRMKNGYPNTSSLKDQTDEFKSGTMPGNESDNVKWQKRKARNDEYNEFLASKHDRDSRRFDDKKQTAMNNAGGNSSLPHLNYSNSAQRREREDERNREYNDMLQQKAQRGRGGPPPPPADVRTGWGTPDYSDILAKNRAKEQNFRRANDIAYEADPMARQTEMVNRALDRDLEATSLDLSDSSRLINEQKQVEEDKGKQMKNNDKPQQTYPNGPPSVRRSKDQGGEYFATLPLGRSTESAKVRQKNQYSNDLKMQMAEAAQARNLERREGLLVNNNAIASHPVVTRPPVARPMPRTQADPYHSILKDVQDYDELSPRSNAILGRRQPTSERLRNKGGLNAGIGSHNDTNGTGILDLGLFSQPRTTSLDPPAGLVYQPS